MLCSTVKGTGLTLDACGAADVVVELLLTISVLRASVMWKNCQEEGSNKRVHVSMSS